MKIVINAEYEHVVYGRVLITKICQDCNGKTYWRGIKTRQDNPEGIATGSEVICMCLKNFR